MLRNNQSILRYLVLQLIAALAVVSACALSLDTYAPSSRLASGRWVKVSVDESGLYVVTPEQLRRWGFTDIDKVRIYGYGGNRIPDALTAENYIDDLPLVQHLSTSQGLVFYAVGPERWVRSNSGVYIADYNIYSTHGYYFISDTGEEPRPVTEQRAVELPQSANYTSTYVQRAHYELDRVSPGEAGYLLVGESFKTQTSRKFAFDISGDSASLECGIVSNSTTGGTVEFTVNGRKLEYNNTHRVPASSQSTYNHGSHSVSSAQFDFTGDKLEVTVSVPAASSMKDCWLDYLAINAVKPIALPASGYLPFWADHTVKMQAAAGTRVWDVTSPLSIEAMSTQAFDGGNIAWINDFHGDRAYVAFADGASLPQPEFVGYVANQDVHAIECPDMVIFTLPEFMAQAQRIAKMHATAKEPLQVAVINVNEVYNEFASGSPDVSALRKCLKMLYDRNQADASATTTLRYALLMGRATYDNRHLTSQFDGSSAHGTIPCWLGGTKSSQMSDNSAYGTDDFVAMLVDGSGINLGLDDLTVAVGRMPARTVEEAKTAVDKLIQYVEKSKTGLWKNSFLFLADDGDNGIHMSQTEDQIEYMLATPGAQNLISKVYVDAYDIIAGSCDDGRAHMYGMLNEGVVWWNYTGHANNHSWTKENMLNYNDINNLYLQHVPVLMAATCDFLRWDSNTLSGGEIFHHERYGGTIATISATRPVYISENALFTNAIGRSINKRMPDGKLPRLGEIYQMAKNNILSPNGDRRSNTNRLRYVLMGDPAMPLAMPSNIARLDAIGSTPVTAESQATLMALQRTTLSGAVCNPQGDVITDFNGTVEVNIYDAEHSVTTQGVRDDNVKFTFEQRGDKLYAGSAPVVDGYFSLNVAMPGEIADNFRPATVNIYAVTTDASMEAVGVNRDIYIYGLDESVPADDTAPVIEWLALNSQSFASGSTVNESPMVMARVRDDVGINLSTAGIGHQMTITLDDNRTYTDVAQAYVPASDGTPSGSIAYQLTDLTDGNHKLRLRVWDTAGNAATQEIEFYVQRGLAPAISEVYCDANPASVETNFYITHDRPDSELTVTIAVYSLMGRPVWESTVKGRADMFTSAPVNWNLTDLSGRRVPRGIYVYRAYISADGGDTYSTASRKIAVTAP